MSDNSQEIIDAHLTLLDNILDPEERELAREELGLPPTVEPMPEQNDPARPHVVDAGGVKPEAAAEPEPEAATEPEPEAATEPEPEAATEPEPEAATEPEPEAATEIAAMRAEIAAMRAQMDALHADSSLRNVDADLRARVSEEMREVLETTRAARAAEDTRIREFEESYGEEASQILRAEVVTRRELEDRENTRQAEEKFNALKTEHQAAAVQQDEIETAVRGHPDLMQWREDFNAFHAGDTGRNNATFAVAIDIDSHLRAQPQWVDKSISERFGEVVRLTKERLAADKPKPVSTQDIQKAVKAGPPESLSHMESGEQKGFISLERALDQMSGIELYKNGLYGEKLDKVLTEGRLS